MLPPTIPLGWRKGHYYFDGRRRIKILAIDDLVPKADVRSQETMASAHL